MNCSKNYQPYWTAWCIAEHICPAARMMAKDLGDNINNIPFMQWIQRKHREFQKINGLSDSRYSAEEQAKFEEFILMEAK